MYLVPHDLDYTDSMDSHFSCETMWLRLSADPLNYSHWLYGCVLDSFCCVCLISKFVANTFQPLLLLPCSPMFHLFGWLSLNYYINKHWTKLSAYFNNFDTLALIFWQLLQSAWHIVTVLHIIGSSPPPPLLHNNVYFSASHYSQTMQCMCEHAAVRSAHWSRDTREAAIGHWHHCPCPGG